MMSEHKSPFFTELEQAIFEPRRKLVHEARSPNVPIRERLLPVGVRLLGLDLSGKLPANLILTDDFKKTAKTASRTFVEMSLNTSAIRMSLRPGINIDVTFLGEASLEAIALVFGESEPLIELQDVGFGIDPRGAIRGSLMKDYSAAIRSSAFAQRGYDWTRDPRLFDNLTRFYQSVSDPFAPRGPFVANLLLDSLTVRAMALRQLRGGEEGMFASLAPGSSITVTINFQSFLGDLIDGSKASKQALANLVILNSIKVQCSLSLFYESQEIGRIESLEIARDGRVFIHDFTIVHSKVAAVEHTINAGAMTLVAFWNLLIEGLKLAPIATSQANTAALTLHGDAVNRALSESLASVVAGAANAQPNIILGEIKKVLEPKLTEEIRQLIRDSLRAIPGVDLITIFDLPKHLK